MRWSSSIITRHNGDSRVFYVYSMRVFDYTDSTHTEDCIKVTLPIALHILVFVLTLVFARTSILPRVYFIRILYDQSPKVTNCELYEFNRLNIVCCSQQCFLYIFISFFFSQVYNKTASLQSYIIDMYVKLNPLTKFLTVNFIERTYRKS